MPEGAVCTGFGEYEGGCTNAITKEALELNGAGLWCVRCEKARRKYLTRQFDAITEGFDPRPLRRSEEAPDAS
jgi:hypothetical protein